MSVLLGTSKPVLTAMQLNPKLLQKHLLPTLAVLGMCLHVRCGVQSFVMVHTACRPAATMLMNVHALFERGDHDAALICFISLLTAASWWAQFVA